METAKPGAGRDEADDVGMGKGVKEHRVEDYICDDTTRLLQGSHLIGRQLCCEYGIMDLLLWGWADGYGNWYDAPHAHIAELKARTASERDCAQVLRYKHAVSDAVTWWWTESKWGFDGGEDGEAVPREIECLLVAPGFSDRAKAVATETGIVMVKIEEPGRFGEPWDFVPQRPFFGGATGRDSKRLWSLTLAALHERQWRQA